MIIRSFLRTENSRAASMQATSLQVIRMITAAVCRNCKGSGGCRSHPYLSHTNIAKSANFVSDYQHSIPHADGSRDASMESSENASIFKTQECLWFRLKRYHCIQRLFVSVQQKSPVWGLFVRHSTAYFYFSRYLTIMQPLFGRYQRPSVKLTPAKSSAVKT